MAITPINANALNLERCPHCSIALPLLSRLYNFDTLNSDRCFQRSWRVYICTKCGGAILGATRAGESFVEEIYPTPATLPEGIPLMPETYLCEAIECVHSPSGSIMLCASSVDAMLKEKGLKDGSLYDRIEIAASKGMITNEMRAWAHEVRLGANNQRHADEAAPLPTESDALKSIEFTKALAMFLFVLPFMVEKGRKKLGSTKTSAAAPPKGQI